MGSSLLQDSCDGAGHMGYVVLRQPGDTQAARAHKVDARHLAQMVYLLGGQTCIGEHAPVSEDVVNVVLVSKLLL
jgi:hypothetical protein